MSDTLVNMQMTDPPHADAPVAVDPGDGPRYPWGLQITLDNAALEKLALPALPVVGETLLLLAKAKITSVSSTEERDGGTQRSVNLQITDLCLEADAPRKSVAERLYGT